MYLKYLLLRDFLPGRQFTLFVELSASLFSALPRGSSLSVSPVSMGSPHIALRAPETRGPAAGVAAQTRCSGRCGERRARGRVLRGRVCLDAHLPQDSKTTTLVDFLEINCSGWYYLDTGERLLPRSIGTYCFSLRKSRFSVFIVP